jgi:hypothetical protein
LIFFYYSSSPESAGHSDKLLQAILAEAVWFQSRWDLWARFSDYGSLD